MKDWDEIIDKALLGSEKAMVGIEDIPAIISSEYDLKLSGEKQEDFLMLSAMVYQFRHSGARPINATAVTSSEAPEEEKPYCSSQSNTVLKGVLDEDLPSLLRIWLQQCVAKNKIVHPEVLPRLIELAKSNQGLHEMITEVMGKRGQWLCSLNGEWNSLLSGIDFKSAWENGTAEERKVVLRNLRISKPDEARSLLETSWVTEGANEKSSFLEILKTNASASDLPWLESLKEKSQKVNGVLFETLKLIPSSQIVQEYQQVLMQCVSIKSSKALLGMISKTELIIDESFVFPESIFKTGIEKLSSNKNVSDHQYILAQLIMNTPPSFWTEHLQRVPGEVIELFQKEKQTAFFIPSLSIAATRYKNIEWIHAIFEKANKDVIGNAVVTLLTGLSGKERDQYALKFFDEQPAQIIQLLLGNDSEWSNELAKQVLKYTAKEVYQYNKQFYRQAILLLPTAMLHHLDSFTPLEEQKKPYWNTQRDELTRLLTIKEQILQSFNA